MALADFLTDEEFAAACKERGNILLEKDDGFSIIATPNEKNFVIEVWEKTGNEWMLDCVYSISKEHVKILSNFVGA